MNPRRNLASVEDSIVSLILIMSGLRPEIEELSVVVLGSFAPQMFHPEWFLRHGLVREKATTNVKVVHPELATIEIDKIRFDVNSGRFQSTTNNPEFYEPIRDIVVACFSILNEIPLTAFGLNRSYHFKAPSLEAWHNVGNKLAPKDVWNRHLFAPGMRSLTIEGKREKDDIETVQVRVEPSARIQPTGIFITLNYHFNLEQDQPEQRSTKLTDILKDRWKHFFAYSEEISKSILDLM